MKKFLALFALGILLPCFSTMKAQSGIENRRADGPASETVWDGQAWSNGAPNAQTKAIFHADFSSNDSFHALSVEIDNRSKITFGGESVVDVVNDINSSTGSKLILTDHAQLLQRNPLSPSSVITLERQTALINKYDYTFFCSPVDGQKANLITDYTWIYSYDNSGNSGTYLPPRVDKYFTWDDTATPATTSDASIYLNGAWLQVPDSTYIIPQAEE